MSVCAADSPRPEAAADDDPPPSAEVADPVALVLFCDAADRWWQRWLKPGFRHCLVLLRIGSQWIACDSLWHGLEFHRLPARRWNPIPFFARRGFTVMTATRRRSPGNRALIAPFTCVEVAKRILGINAAWVLTPWQLYNKLKILNCEKKHCKTPFDGI